MLDLLNQKELVARYRERREALEQPTRADVIEAWWRMEQGEDLTPKQMKAVCLYLRSRFAKHAERGRAMAYHVENLVALGIAPDGRPSALELVGDRHAASVSKVRRMWREWKATLQKK